MAETPAIPSAQIVTEAGLAQVAPYAARLFSATKQAAVLMISSLTGQEAITIMRMGDLVMFHLIAVWDPGSPQEKAAWQCFARLGVSAEEKQQPHARIIGFSLPGGSQQNVTDTARALLTDVYGIQSADGLKFRFDERDF